MKITELPHVSLHNHDVKQTIAAYYPENRRPSTEESARILQMLAAVTAPRFVATAINAARHCTGNVGIITDKNIFNVATKDRTRKYGGRAEYQVLAVHLTKLRIADPAGCYEIFIDDDEDFMLKMVYYQTSAMKAMFVRNPQVKMLD